MSYSLGLTLYNLAGRREMADRPVWPPRPRGRLVWLHAPAVEQHGAMLALARRLIEEDGLPVLLTSSVLPNLRLPGLVPIAPPTDTPLETQAFLAHWLPEIILFADGELRPALVHEAALRHIPMLMIDARTPHLLHGRDGWYPGLTRTTLAAFRHILTHDDASARAFRKSGAVPTHVESAGRMEQDSVALPYVEADRFALAKALATRPVWLAADLPEAEEAAVIAAHREALRLSHRLMLILSPQDPARAPALAQSLEDREGWSVAQRGLHQEPDGDTEVYIPDSEAEFGLWYRLAPVTFLGGSLLGEGCARNPLEPAALGSAIIYGTKPGAYGAMFTRLGAVRAARMVASPDDLAQAVADLLSPDRAAKQAHAAWNIASEGADVTVRVVSLIRGILDGEG
ncbi:MAG: 3-deoxy-D-manno-octulosonic acid transferase [Paracoccaceae bacterium]